MKYKPGIGVNLQNFSLLDMVQVQSAAGKCFLNVLL